MKVPASGMVIVRDGEMGEPESISLSPVMYSFEHQAEVEVIVQQADQAQRDTKLDTILTAIGTLLEDEPTLQGAVTYARAGAPELMEEVIEGSPTIKAAMVPIILEYTTTNPLQ